MNKKKPKDFRTETFFVHGKMKKRRIPLVGGLEVEEFIRRNAVDAFLVQEGYFEILHERELLRNNAQPDALKHNVGTAPFADEALPRVADLGHRQNIP